MQPIAEPLAILAEADGAPEFLLQAGEAVQTPCRLPVAESEGEPEEVSVDEGEGHGGRRRGEVAGAVAGDAAVDDFAEGVEVVALPRLPVVGGRVL